MAQVFFVVFHFGRAREGIMPCRQQVGNDSQCIAIRSSRCGVGILDLFRGNGLGRADGEAGAREARFAQHPRNPKVSNRKLTIAVHQNVLRFQVTMDDILRMRVIQGSSDLLENLCALP